MNNMKLKVVISNEDGEVLDILLVRPNEARDDVKKFFTSVRFANAIVAHLEDRFEVEE